MISRMILFLFLFISFLLTPASAFSKKEVPARDQGIRAQQITAEIEVKDGRIFMDVKEAEIVNVLKEIAEKADIDISIDEGVKGKISTKMSGVTIEDAVKKLCESRAIVFDYFPEDKSYKIIKAGVYTGKKGEEEGRVNNAVPSVTTHKEMSPKTTVGEAAQKSARTYDSKGRRLYKPGELLVRFKQGATEKQISELHRSLGSRVIGRVRRLRFQRIALRKDLSEKEGIALYFASGLVESAERHALRYIHTTPNDTYFSSQWGLQKIQAPKSWDISQGSPDIVIAAIDTGVGHDHPDLMENVWINTDESIGDANKDGFPGVKGVDDDGDGLVDEDSQGRQPGEAGYTNDLKDDDDENGYVDDIRGWDFAGEREADPSDGDADPMDVDGHGTHVTGIIGAEGNNSEGVAGVCWHVKVMMLKVQADNGEFIEVWDVILAVHYAIDNGARIVNCSFGGEFYHQQEYEAFQALKDADILAVCAAGNGDSAGIGINTDLGIKNYPSSYDLDNIISVAASDEYDELAGFSNYGPVTVDVMAPGVNIRSTLSPSTYTDAHVKVQTTSGTIEYEASGLTYAGTTDENGITRPAYYCGLGNPEDFPSQVTGNIALIERGVLYFSEKATNAQSVGAVGVIVYNNEPGDFLGTLIIPDDWVPVVSISGEDGEQLRSLETQPPIVTLINNPTYNPSSYGVMAGTSMAAPHVSGIAGLMLARNPCLGYARVKSEILRTADSIPSVVDKLVSGSRVNAFAALSSLQVIQGDLSGDEVLGVEDAILALQIVSAASPDICWGSMICEIDVNGDGRIGIREASYILQKVSGARE